MYFINTGEHAMKSTLPSTIFASTTSAATIFAEATMAAAALVCLALPAQVWAAGSDISPARNVQIDSFAVGKKAIEDKKWQQAVDAFNKVVVVDPTNADAYNYLGFANRWLDKYPEAFAAYNKALTLEPTHKGALNYSGIAYLKSGQKAKAQEQLAKLTQLCAQCEETTQLAQAIASAP
jgi:Flp pilus assembly protein TadD